MKKLLLAAAALVALGAAGQAQATCVSSTQISAPDPGAGTTCSITADASTVDIVFAYKSAADVDLLLNGVSLLISNQDTLGTEATITGLRWPGSRFCIHEPNDRRQLSGRRCRK